MHRSFPARGQRTDKSQKKVRRSWDECRYDASLVSSIQTGKKRCRGVVAWSGSSAAGLWIGWGKSSVSWGDRRRQSTSYDERRTRQSTEHHVRSSSCRDLKLLKKKTSFETDRRGRWKAGERHSLFSSSSLSTSSLFPFFPSSTPYHTRALPVHLTARTAEQRTLRRPTTLYRPRLFASLML